eukprot:7388172-Prymnesium_polylepis.2
MIVEPSAFILECRLPGALAARAAWGLARSRPHHASHASVKRPPVWAVRGAILLLRCLTRSRIFASPHRGVHTSLQLVDAREHVVEEGGLRLGERSPLGRVAENVEETSVPRSAATQLPLVLRTDEKLVAPANQAANERSAVAIGEQRGGIAHDDFLSRRRAVGAREQRPHVVRVGRRQPGSCGGGVISVDAGERRIRRVPCGAHRKRVFFTVMGARGCLVQQRAM